MKMIKKHIKKIIVTLNQYYQKDDRTSRFLLPRLSLYIGLLMILGISFIRDLTLAAVLVAIIVELALFGYWFFFSTNKCELGQVDVTRY